MNIILINHYASIPEMGMEFRPYYLAKEWVKLGNDVTIIAASFSHLRKKQPKIKEEIKIELIEGIRYIWIKTPTYKGNSTGRIFNMFYFVKKLQKYSKKIATEYKPNVVIASSTYPLDIFPAKKISKKSKAKLIFEIHDLWPLSPMELGGYSKYHPFIMTMQYAENFAYKNVNAVISILPKTKQHTIEHGLPPQKWFHVPNGIVIENTEGQEKIPENYKKILEKLKSENKIIIGYAGGHAISNSLNTLVETAKILRDNSKFVFVLVGNGTEKQNLIKQSKGLPNIVFLDSIPKKQIPNLLSYTDYLFIGWQKSNLYRFGISPNKIFDYMLAEKPIIHAVTAGNDNVKEANAGISIKPENPKAIADAIIELNKMSDQDKINFGKNGKNYVIKNHDYKILSANFLQILKQC